MSAPRLAGSRRILTVSIVLCVATLSSGAVVGQNSAPRAWDTFEDVPAGHWADQAIG